MQKILKSDDTLLVEIETILCDNLLQFPYYPVVAITVQNSTTYIAFKAKDNIAIYIIKKDICTKYRQLKSLTSKSFLTSIVFVNPEFVENKKDQGSLYLLLGYSGGNLYLVKVQNTLNIIKKYNKASDSQSGLLSKTMSFFSGPSSEYATWQNTAVMKLKIMNKSFSYLFRNGVLVIGKLNMNIQNLQKKYEQLLKCILEICRNKMMKVDNYFYYVCNDYKMIRQDGACIISFSNTVSSYQITQSSLFVGTYNGLLLQFETQTYLCLRRIQTVVAIKHLSIIKNYLVLCLQDDYTQLIDLYLNKYVNLTGHSSFTACALGLNSTIFLASYDRCISITNPSKIKDWRKLQCVNQNQTSFNIEPIAIEVDQKSKLKTQSGIGTGVINSNILVLSTFDNRIKIFKVNLQQLE